MLSFKTSLRSRGANWAKLRTVVSDMSDFWQTEGIDYVRDWYRRLFQTQGASQGKAWAPHRPATVAIRAKQGARGGIGWHSGKMRNSLTRKNAAEAIRTVRGNTLTYGTTVNHNGFDYPARFHSGGTVKKVFGNVVKKPYRQKGRPLFLDPMPQQFTKPLRAKMDAWIQRRIIKEGL